MIPVIAVVCFSLGTGFGCWLACRYIGELECEECSAQADEILRAVRASNTQRKLKKDKILGGQVLSHKPSRWAHTS